MTVASELFRIRREYTKSEENLLRVVHKILGESDDVGEWKFDFDLDRCDPVDWDGVCLDLNECTPGVTFTPDQQEQVWAIGFTVIRINYVGSDSVSGDWWIVKGREPKTCAHKEARS